MHRDLLIIQKFVYEPCGFVCKNIVQESESQEYGAHEFDVNMLRIKFRVARITPTKIGQFVTFWKRNETGAIIPYDILDTVDLFVVSVRNRDNFGQFVFPKSLLYEKGFLSKEGKGGKRAMRVYPPWDITNNKQAHVTQTWQLHYFFEIEPNFDIVGAQKLYQRKGI
jgi:hypothetical protein